MTKLSQRASRLRLLALCLIVSSPLVIQSASEPDLSASLQDKTAAQNGTASLIRTLPSFGKIALCVPFTTALQPSVGHHITIDADPHVAESIGVAVINDTVSLNISAVVIRAPLRLIIGLPVTALKSLSISGVGSVMIFPGFRSDDLTISASGTGSVHAHGMDATRVHIYSTGTSGIELTGSIGSANITVSGTGKTEIAGLRISAAVRASGTSSTILQTTSETAAISGTVEGLAKVYYSNGTCNIQENIPNSPFGSPCQRKEYVPANTSTIWTCDINITAPFNCNGGLGSSLSIGGVQCPSVEAPADQAVNGSNAVAPGLPQAPTPAAQSLMTFPAVAPYPSGAAESAGLSLAHG